MSSNPARTQTRPPPNPPPPFPASDPAPPLCLSKNERFGCDISGRGGVVPVDDDPPDAFVSVDCEPLPLPPPPPCMLLLAVAATVAVRCSPASARRHPGTRRRQSERPSAANAAFGLLCGHCGGRPLRERRRRVVGIAVRLRLRPPSICLGRRYIQGPRRRRVGVCFRCNRRRLHRRHRRRKLQPRLPQAHRFPTAHTCMSTPDGTLPSGARYAVNASGFTAGTGTPRATRWEGAS